MELSKWAKKKVLVNVSLCILHLYDQTFGYRGIFMFSLISIKFKNNDLLDHTCYSQHNIQFFSKIKAEPTACSYSIYQDQIFLKNIPIWPWPNFDPWPLCPSPPWPLSGCRPVAVATTSGCRLGTRRSSLPCVSSRRVGYGVPRSVWVGPPAEVEAVLSPGTGPEQNQEYLRNWKLSLGQWE